MTSAILDMGIHQQDVGDFLANVLKNSSKPLTHILERLSGTQLAIKILADGERALSEAESFRLDAAGIIRCRWRTGLLVAADGTVAASVALIWLPPRIPFDACRDLDAGGQPAGVILGRLGMTRQDRRAMATRGIEEVTGADAAVRSTAVLAVNGQLVGVADECITRQFAEGLAGLARVLCGLQQAADERGFAFGRLAGTEAISVAVHVLRVTSGGGKARMMYPAAPECQQAGLPSDRGRPAGTHLPRRGLSRTGHSRTADRGSVPVSQRRTLARPARRTR